MRQTREEWRRSW